MQTTADEKLNQAHALLREAITNVQEVTLHQCQGHDLFELDYLKEIEQAEDHIVKAYRLLRR